MMMTMMIIIMKKMRMMMILRVMVMMSAVGGGAISPSRIKKIISLKPNVGSTSDQAVNSSFYFVVRF